MPLIASGLPASAAFPAAGSKMVAEYSVWHEISTDIPYPCLCCHTVPSAAWRRRWWLCRLFSASCCAMGGMAL